MVVGAAALSPALVGSAAAASPPRPRNVPRNRTLSLVWFGSREGRWVDYELWNPYAVGANHQNGPNLLYEPLAYYSAFADKEYMWLAESYKYTADFKELTIKTRSGIKWSDGKPFSAEDVAYTLTSLRDLGPKVRWGVNVRQFMQEAKATDRNTVVLKFNVPAPRFFSFLTYKYDIGVYIVPKHIFQGQDWTMFKHFDMAKDWPVTTGPWRVAFASPEQKVLDRRTEWWAAKAGLAPLPKVERNVWLPSAGEQQLAQALITNQVDYGQPMQPATFPTMFKGNPKIITHSGQKPPYGYMDWWPISLYVNNERPPFNDKDVRWALSYFIDRQADRRRGLCRGLTNRRAPDAGISAVAPLLRRGEGSPGETEHARIQSQEGRRVAHRQGLEEGQHGILGRRPGEPPQARHHRVREQRTGHRAGDHGALDGARGSRPA